MASDLVLETLLAVRNEVAPNLDENLLRQCYEVQRKYQFDRDRVHAARAMERLIDDLVDTQFAKDPLKVAQS